VINPEEIGKWSEVSDEDAKKVFEQRRDRSARGEREVSQMVFSQHRGSAGGTQPHHGGLSFDDLAKERNLNLSDVDLA